MKIHESILFWRNSIKVYCGEQGPIISVHYRNVEQGLTGRLIEEVRKTADGSGFIAITARWLLRICPATPYSKGTALAEISGSGLSPWRNGNAFVYIGDDRTDEDAFGFIPKAGPGAFGFKVGEEETLADFRLSEPEEEKILKMMTGEET